jgi:hypothetical protein
VMRLLCWFCSQWFSHFIFANLRYLYTKRGTLIITRFLKMVDFGTDTGTQLVASQRDEMLGMSGWCISCRGCWVQD